MTTYNGVSLSAQGASAPVPILPNRGALTTPITSLGLICTMSSGASLTYSVQVSADPTNPTNWNNHDVLVGQTASANGNIAYPVTFVRLNVTAYVSGSVNLGIAQWP
jgi:hypothetical protein